MHRLNGVSTIPKNAVMARARIPASTSSKQASFVLDCTWRQYLPLQSKPEEMRIRETPTKSAWFLATVCSRGPRYCGAEFVR